QVDERNTKFGDGTTHAQVQNRHFLLQVGAEEHDDARTIAVTDFGAPHADNHLGREAVAELRVDIVGADDTPGEARPRVRVFVRAVRAAEHRNGTGTVIVTRFANCGRRRVERVGPRHFVPRVAGLYLRFQHTIFGVHPSDAVATLVAQPAVVHGVGV